MLSFDEPQTISFKQGTSWRAVFHWRDPSGDPLVLTDCQARAQLRDHRTGALIATWTSETGELTFDVVEGDVLLEVEPDDSVLIPLGTYVTDMVLTWLDGVKLPTPTFQVDVTPLVTQS